MKFVNKLSVLGGIVLILITAQLVVEEYRTHYIMILLILLLGVISYLIKSRKQVQLIPGVGKHLEEIDKNMISTIMGNLFWMITSMLLVFEIGEIIYPGFTRIFIWFSIIPIAIYVRIILNKISKDTRDL